uniref:Uncharacterized protein n=1 Tax=Romanomermis culicivorax TaxID=13658 RepID=A0A915KVN2_ROMCU
MEISHLDPSIILPKLTRKRLSETARLLRHAFTFRRTASAVSMGQDLQRGFAFSQEENGVVTQSQIVRAYDSTKAKPEGM